VECVMRRSKKLLGSVFFGLIIAANAPPASAATDDSKADYPFRECIEQTVTHIRDISMKIGRFAKRTGMEISRQSKKFAETFRDGGREIWSAASKNDDQ